MKDISSTGRLRKKINLFSIILVVVGVTVGSLGATLSPFYLPWWGLLMASMAATFAVGALIGFLFGIPRYRKIEQEEEEQRSRYFPNTNLEIVSDWLTKIIVGITLVELHQIANYMKQLANFILPEQNSLQVDSHLGHPLLIALITYAVITGFVIAYLYTRLYLSRIFELLRAYNLQANELNRWKNSEVHAR